MAQDNKWIQKAIKRPGAFTEWCEKHGFRGASFSCIEEAIKRAKKTGNDRLLRQAYLARTLKTKIKRRKK